MQILRSELDASVNFVHEKGFESRYVRRPDSDYFIAYLSSHTGCNKSCRFCHLTQTGQTDMIPAEWVDFAQQAWPVFIENAHSADPVKKMHFNFMARGEPLANWHILHHWYELEQILLNMAHGHEIEDISFKISTIMPTEMTNKRLTDVFGHSRAELYYSLYSLNKDFRKRWIPKSMNPYLALAKLKEWQDETGGIVVIHFPIIAGQNDEIGEHLQMAHLIKDIGLETRFNLVRYNPPDPKSAESKHAFDLFYEVWEPLFPQSQIVGRVGFDVKASCGMFV